MGLTFSHFHTILLPLFRRRQIYSYTTLHSISLCYHIPVSLGVDWSHKDVTGSSLLRSAATSGGTGGAVIAYSSHQINASLLPALDFMVGNKNSQSLSSSDSVIFQTIP